MSNTTWKTVAAAAAFGLGTIAAAGAQRSTQTVRWLAVGAHVQGYLGVSFREVSDEQLAALAPTGAHGVEITQVDHDGPAGKAGVREHDVLLQLNGQNIDGVDPLRRMLRDIPAGRAVTLILLRDGQTQTVTTLLANREALERQAWDQHIPVPDPAQSAAAAPAPASPAPNPNPRSDRPTESRGSGSMGFFGAGAPSGSALGTHPADRNLVGSALLPPSYTGAALESLGPQLANFFGVSDGNGLLVRSIESNSPAATAGLRAGDVVVRVNQVAILAGSDWLRLMHESKGRPVQVLILREKKEQLLILTPDAKRRSSIVLPPLPADPAVVAACQSTSVAFAQPRP